MRERYIAVSCEAQTERQKSFCARKLQFDLDGVEQELLLDTFIPKSVIHFESFDTIEEAARGDRIEIYVAMWWLEKQV